MSEVKVTANYSSIEAIRDICEPWIEQWSGDEWGESMDDLHGAAHTSYGLSDEDCAIIAEMLWRNIEWQYNWVKTEGQGLEMDEPEDMERAATKAREARDYWLKGGNLGDFHDTIKNAKETIDALPAWVFGEEEHAES